MIRTLELARFRNYTTERLEFDESGTLFFGDNGAGKTNLLEAVFLLGTGRSFRARENREMVREGDTPRGEARAEVAGVFEFSGDRFEVRIGVARRGGSGSGGIRCQLDGKAFGRSRLPFRVPIVLSTPDDREILTGAPEERRRYLDLALARSSERAALALVAFRKRHLERNVLLKRAQAGSVDETLLDVARENAARTGARIQRFRAALTAALAPYVANHYRDLADDREALAIAYAPDFRGFVLKLPERDSRSPLSFDPGDPTPEEVSALHDGLKATERDDILRGSASRGPARDELEISLASRPISRYGSQGQIRTAALALKLAERDLAFALTARRPLFLVDDLGSELDRGRLGRLLETVTRGSQVLVTTTDLARYPAAFVAGARAIRVRDGRLEASPLGVDTLEVDTHRVERPESEA